MFQEIIERCEFVAQHSKFVKIKEQELEKWASSIREIESVHWLSSSPYGLLDLPVEMIINFLLFYEAIDFSFWGDPKWTIQVGKEKEDGSLALLYKMLTFVKQKGKVDFSEITKEEFAKMLEGNIKIPLWEERYHIIKEVNQVMQKKMNGNFYSFVQNVKEDQSLFQIIITYFPNFKDERTYQGKTIPFYKLAQLLTSDILQIRNYKEGIPVDCSHLVGCADYKIPQIMRELGLLEYTEELAKQIDQKKEIEKNSEYEVEIRANMLVVIERIKQKLENKVNAITINDFIWLQSKTLEKPIKPYHLTRCTNY